jgi:HicB family
VSEAIPTTVRLPEKTHEAARVAAARLRMSLNQYVIEALEKATLTHAAQWPRRERPTPRPS